MAFDYVVTARRNNAGVYDDEPGPVRFLKVPTSATDFDPSHAVSSPKEWAAEVVGLADGDENPLSISPTGDVLVFVHGYNNSREVVLQRLRQLRADLRAEKWRGAVIAFDWPSHNKTLNYIEDRQDAAKVAIELVRKCLDLIVEGQKRDCQTNIHLLCHSTGAYVAMEAFVQAEKNGDFFKSDWRLGQVAFVGADVSSGSLSRTDSWSAPMFRRIMRLTNYSNPYDSVLAVSNAKRLGVSPRAGRTGLPDDAHPKSVNVDCGSYFASLDPKTATYVGSWTHSWHIGSRVFARDLAMTLEGAVDRGVLPTRRNEGGILVLQDAERPLFMEDWNIKAGITAA